MQPVEIHSLNMTLQPGTEVTLPARFVHLDPDHYPDPRIFNGYRFYDADLGTCNTRSLFKDSETWLAFRIGTSACPARLMATRIYQAIFARILLFHDLNLVEDMKRDFPVHLYSTGDAVSNPDVTMRISNRRANDPCQPKCMAHCFA